MEGSDAEDNGSIVNVSKNRPIYGNNTRIKVSVILWGELVSTVDHQKKSICEHKKEINNYKKEINNLRGVMNNNIK